MHSHLKLRKKLRDNRKIKAIARGKINERQTKIRRKNGRCGSRSVVGYGIR